MDYSITRLITGAYQFDAMVDGRLVTRTYHGFTRREAIAEFKRDMRRDSIIRAEFLRRAQT